MKSLTKKKVNDIIFWSLVLAIITMSIGCIGYYLFGVTDGVVKSIGQFGGFLGIFIAFFSFGTLIEEKLS